MKPYDIEVSQLKEGDTFYIDGADYPQITKLVETGEHFVAYDFEYLDTEVTDVYTSHVWLAVDGVPKPVYVSTKDTITAYEPD